MYFSTLYFILKTSSSKFHPHLLFLNMLLYIGACEDLSPLTRFAHAHKEFIYVDGLPKSKYFPKECHGGRYDSVEVIRDTMVWKLKREGAFDRYEMLDDHFIIWTSSGAKITYFYNTKDVEMTKNKTLKALLPQVTALYMQGFFPTIK